MRAKKKGDPIKQDNTRVKKPLDPDIIRLLEARKELSPYPGGATSIREIPDHKDSIVENILEAVPPFGSILSIDDAEDAYRRMRQRGAFTPNFNEAVDMAGVIPFGGTAAKAPVVGSALIELAKQSPKYLQILQSILGVYDSAQDISEDNLK